MQHSKFAILMILCFFMVWPATAQQTNQTDSRGRKQGKWVKFYPNDVKQYEATFRNDQLIGSYKRFYPTGDLKAHLQYQSPGGFASAVFYDRKGKKVSEGFFNGKQKDSIWKYYTGKGRLIMQEEFDNGKRSGAQKFYHRTGQLAEVKHFKQGKQHGYWKKYYPDGDLLLETYYRDDKLDGWYISYYPDGSMETEGKYENNQRDSVWTYYTREGKVSHTLTYKNGDAQNRDSLDKEETDLINQLEKNRGKIPDPREEFYQNTRFGGRR